MIEIKGNIWNTSCSVICIPTNGFLKKNDEIVMGRGVALQAKQKYNALPLILGNRIKEHGNTPFYLKCSTLHDLCSFPTKHNWWEKADIELIKKSVILAHEVIPEHLKVALPRPGCSNGKLDWKDVKKAIEPILNKRFIIYSI